MNVPVVPESVSLQGPDDCLRLVSVLGMRSWTFELDLRVNMRLETVTHDTAHMLQQLESSFSANTSVGVLRLKTNEATMLVPVLERLVPLLTPLEHLSIDLAYGNCTPIARTIPDIFHPPQESGQKITLLSLIHVRFNEAFDVGWKAIQTSNTLAKVTVYGCSFNVANTTGFVNCFKRTKKANEVCLELDSGTFEGTSMVKVAKDIFMDCKLASMTLSEIGHYEEHDVREFFHVLMSHPQVDESLPRLSLSIAYSFNIHIVCKMLPKLFRLRHLCVTSRSGFDERSLAEFKAALKQNGRLYSAEFDIPDFGRDWGKPFMERNRQLPSCISNVNRDSLQAPKLLAVALQTPQLSCTYFLTALALLADTIGPLEEVATAMETVAALQVYNAAMKAYAAAAAHAVQAQAEVTAATTTQNVAEKKCQAALAKAIRLAADMALKETIANDKDQGQPLDRQQSATIAAAHAAAAQKALVAATKAAAAIQSSDRAAKVAASADMFAAQTKTAATIAATSFLTSGPVMRAAAHPRKPKRPLTAVNEDAESKRYL